MAPKVTVLMPVYNGADLVRAAIDGVLAQTFTDFELLVVDDASTDDSAAVVDAYADPRISVVRNERNLGQVPSTNRGLHEARGEYVARLDQDDVPLPTRLERQVAVLDAEENVAVAGSWLDYVDERGRVTESLRATIDDFPHFLYLLLANALPLAHSAVMYRREEVLALGGYDEEFALAEDMDLWRRLALRRREARVVPEVLLRYLVHGGQQSHARGGEQRERNRASFTRFVEAFSDAEAAAAAWRLETLDIDPPPDAHRYTAALDRMLTGARTHFEVDDRLDRLVRAHVARMARRSWRSDLSGAPALASWAGERMPLLTRAAAPFLRNARKARRYHGRDD